MEADRQAAGQQPLYTPPLGAIETTLAAIWSEALRTKAVGRETTLSDCGGDPRTAALVADRIRQTLGVNLPLSAFSDTRSLAEIASMIRERRRRALAPILPAPRSAPLPLSQAQRGLWFLSQLEPQSTSYHVPLAYRIRGELHSGAIQRALDGLLRRHEALRTRFDRIDGEVLQRIDPPETGFALTHEDLSSRTDADERLRVLMTQEAHAPLDLERGPLARGRLIRLAATEHVLLITLHHINCDGLSLGIILRELRDMYMAFRRGAPDPLPPLKLQYADYAAWQRQWLSAELLSELSAWWKDKLAGVPDLLELPADRRRTRHSDFAGGVVPLALDPGITAGLKALGLQTRTTLFTVLLAGWALVLSRLSGQEHLVIGTPAATRTRTELEGLVGLFVNTLPLPMDVSGNPTLEELLQRIHTITLEAHEHQGLAFEQIVEAVKPTRSLTYTPLFQVMFAWEGDDTQRRLELPGLEVTEIPQPTLAVQFDLTLSLAQSGDCIVGGLSYATALFDETTIRRHATYLRRVLSQMVYGASRAAA